MESSSLKKLGVWLPEKKSHKLNWNDLRAACVNAGYELIKLDLRRNIEEQGTLHIFLHKLTDQLALSDMHDEKATAVINRVKQYLSNHPEVTVVDSLDKVRILLYRNQYYTILQEEPSFSGRGVFTPPFAHLTNNNHERNTELLRSRGVTFPAVIKPNVSHGSKAAHRMTLALNWRSLAHCRPPCVVQSFVNHNAVLYKVYIIGNRYHISERPSLKNFYPSEEAEPIHFNTGDVCKADSQSTLSILDPHDKMAANFKMALDENKIRHIIKILNKKIGLLLYGFDVVIDNENGDHAVIDINVFPGYDNYPDYFGNLLAGIQSATEAGGYGECNGLVNVGEDAFRLNVNGA